MKKRKKMLVYKKQYIELVHDLKRLQLQEDKNKKRIRDLESMELQIGLNGERAYMRQFDRGRFEEVFEEAKQIILRQMAAGLR